MRVTSLYFRGLVAFHRVQLSFLKLINGTYVALPPVGAHAPSEHEMGGQMLMDRLRTFLQGSPCLLRNPRWTSAF